MTTSGNSLFSESPDRLRQSKSRPYESRQPIAPHFQTIQLVFHKRSLWGIRGQFSVTWTAYVSKLMSNIDGSSDGLSTSCGTPLLVDTPKSRTATPEIIWHREAYYARCRWTLGLNHPDDSDDRVRGRETDTLIEQRPGQHWYVEDEGSRRCPQSCRKSSGRNSSEGPHEG